MTNPHIPMDPRRGQQPPAPPTPPTPAGPAPAMPPAPPAPPVAPPAAPAPPAPPAPPAAPVPPGPSFASAPPPAPPGYAGQPGSSYAPTPPALQPFGATSFVGDTTTIQDRVETKPSMIGRIGLVAAALAVAGGGAFAVTRALSEPAGPQSPEEAVDQMFEAIENDDLIGLSEVMLPSERESVLDPMADLFAELERLDVLDEEFDFESNSDGAGDDGLDFTVSGLTYTTTPIGDGVVNAELTGGIVTVVGDVGDLPLGSRIDDELGAEAMAESIDEEIVNFANETDARFTLVEEDGSWYVSFWYTVAEAARTEAGAPAPAFGQGVTPAGGNTPEDAVRIMMERAVDLDAEGTIAALDPAEFRALHDYAPLFLDDADEIVAELRREAAAEGVTWSLDRLDLSSTDVRGRTVVQINGFAFAASGDGESVSIDFDGECLTLIEGQTIDEICLDEITNEMDLPEAYAEFLEGYTSGITVVERDGQWFVSGMPTIIGTYTDILAAFEPGDIEDLTAFFEESVNSGFGLVDPFGVDPFQNEGIIIEDWDEEPFDESFDEDYDPFAEGDEVDDYVIPPVDPAAVEVFVPGLELSGGEAEYSYFAGVTNYPATWYAYGYSPETFGNVEIVAFDVSADELIVAMDQVSAYERIEVEGLPEGAVAYEWPDVDIVVVVDNYLVSAYYGFDANQDLLLEQVLHIANR